MDYKSISIIGSTDGPTSIFITTSINWPLIIGLGISIVLLLRDLLYGRKKISNKLDILWGKYA